MRFALLVDSKGLSTHYVRHPYAGGIHQVHQDIGRILAGSGRSSTEMVFSSHLMQALQEHVVGREYAIAALSRAVTLAMAGRHYSDSSRPLATLLFAGPTGAGKMHVAQALTKVLLGNE